MRLFSVLGIVIPLFLCSALVQAQSPAVANGHTAWHRNASPGSASGALAFSTGIGGSGLSVGLLHQTRYTDFASGIALDNSGNIYITGLAYSPDFPLVNPLPISPPAQGPYTTCPPSFVAKLSPDGKTILYSTFLTGCSEAAPAITADANGNVYVAGGVAGGYALVQVGGGAIMPDTDDAFIVKLDANGALKAAFTFGGADSDAATSSALGPDGQLYVTGTTKSSDFPVTPGTVRQALSSQQDIFLIKLDPGLMSGNKPPADSILYSTYLGPGTSPFVAADAAGNVYVAGSTTSTAWDATPGVFQSQCWDASREGCADGIVLKLNPTASQFIYTTYLGGSESDTIGGLAVDGSGNAYLAGSTDSFDFPTTPGAYVTESNLSSASFSQTSFAVKLSADASQLDYGTFLAQQGGLTGAAIAVDGSGNAWIGGWADADLLPVTNGIQQTLFNPICYSFTPSGATPTGAFYCPQAGYVAELNSSGSSLLWATYLGSGNAQLNSTPQLTLQPVVSAIVPGRSGDVFVAGNQSAITNEAAAPSKYNSASVVKIDPAGASLTNLAVQNAAGFQSGLPAPGGIAALYVNGIPTSGVTAASGLPLPTQLAGVTVLVDGIAAPIIAVAGLPHGQTQVNFQVPFEVFNGGVTAHIVEAQYGGQSAFIVPQQAPPGIFALPDGTAAVEHASDYSLVTLQNPVKRGETLIIYASGLGYVSTPIGSGLATTEADPIGPNQCNQVTTNAGNVTYAGLAPGFPGLYQVNVQVSQYLPPGLTFIYLQSQGCFPFVPPMNSYQGNGVAIYIAN